MRSGEGTAEEIMNARKKMEEKGRLEDMLRNGEYSNNPEDNKKLYKLYLEHAN